MHDSDEFSGLMYSVSSNWSPVLEAFHLLRSSHLHASATHLVYLPGYSLNSNPEFAVTFYCT